MATGAGAVASSAARTIDRASTLSTTGEDAAAAAETLGGMITGVSRTNGAITGQEEDARSGREEEAGAGDDPSGKTVYTTQL